MGDTAGIAALKSAIEHQKAIVSEHHDALAKEQERIDGAQESIKTITANMRRQTSKLAEMEADLDRLMEAICQTK